MKLLLTSLLAFLLNNGFSQSSVVYKKNLFGELEVYKSQSGLPIGPPIYKIKKNIYGYLEIENIDVTTNPFTKKPDYSKYNSFKPYQLPVKEIFQTLETLNKRYELDYITSNSNSNTSSNNSKYEEELRTYLKNRSNIANSFLSFYNSNISFPKKLSDGWYDVIKIYKLENPETSNYKYGICKVNFNKVVEYYENINIFDIKSGSVFQKIKLELVSPINSCKSTFKAADDGKYYSLHFLDNILDSSKQISNPNYALFSIYTSNTSKYYSNLYIDFQIARNKTITREEVLEFTGGPYSASLYILNPESSQCNDSYLTLAFKGLSDRFSVGISRMNDKKIWLLNDLLFTPGSCTSTSLNER